MLKIATTLFIMIAVLTVTITAPVHGQPPAKSGPNEPVAQNQPAIKADKPQPDLKKVFDEETKKFNARSAEFDPVKLEHEQNKKQAKKGWTKQDKIFLGVFIAALTVLVVLLVKYGKTCAETSPRNCNIGTDDNCYCERYEEDNDKGRGITLP